MRPTSIRCQSAWQLNPGRNSTYRSGKSVQTTGTSSRDLVQLIASLIAYASRMLERSYFEAIKEFEGFAPRARWDYAQFTNGFGTRARHPSEVIDATEADGRFRAEVSEALRQVDQFAPGLSEGARAALTSLTFNAGASWMHRPLGQAVAKGDLAVAREILLQYDKAGGQQLPGLQMRRAQEAAWLVSRSASRDLLSGTVDYLANASVVRPAADIPSNPAHGINRSSVCALPKSPAAEEPPIENIEKCVDRSELFHIMFFELLGFLSQYVSPDAKPDKRDSRKS